MKFIYYLGHLLTITYRWFRGLFRSDVHGLARWMNRFERSSFLTSKNKGLIFSENNRLSLSDSFKNLGLIAPTGSGKTTKFVIPNVLRCEGSVVVTDPSGEIFERTSGHMSARGYRVHVLQPADLANSLRFNPLKRFRTTQELRQLAFTLGTNSTGSGDPFWTTTAINILFVCLSALVNVEDEELIHLGNVRWLLNNFGVEGEGINNFMRKYLDDTAFSEYTAFLAQDSKVIASILSSARAALDLWSDPDVVRLSASDSVNIERLRDEKTIFYIIVPEHRVKYFSLFINLFYSACFEHCLKTTVTDKSLPVFFFLDEFGNMGRINNFAAIATTLRKRRCSINIILQELSQLFSVYGQHESKSIYSGGMGNKLFYSGLDLDTCEYLEKILGANTAYDVAYGDFNEKARTVAKPLMSKDEIRMLKDKEGVLISGRQRPIKMKMPPYFRVSSLNSLTKKKPFEIKIDYAAEEVKYLELNSQQRLFDVEEE